MSPVSAAECDVLSIPVRVIYPRSVTTDTNPKCERLHFCDLAFNMLSPTIKFISTWFTFASICTVRATPTAPNDIDLIIPADSGIELLMITEKSLNSEWLLQSARHAYGDFAWFPYDYIEPAGYKAFFGVTTAVDPIKGLEKEFSIKTSLWGLLRPH